ncbi:MAG: FkbM family methyltransferase [Chloroflexota bacterium]
MRATTRPAAVTPAGDPLEFRDGWSFAVNNREQVRRIWEDGARGREYEAGRLPRNPVIVDAGAHVGVASHWLARRYPDALVLAYEANPDTFRLLRRNLAVNGMTRVLPFNIAIGTGWDGVTFYTMPNDTWGDAAVRHVWHDERTVEMRVPSAPLSALLSTPVDLLKLDVEGVEAAALREARASGALGNARRLVMEFHGSAANQENRLDDVLETLGAAGFTVRIEQDGKAVRAGRIRRDDPLWLILRGSRDGWRG